VLIGVATYYTWLLLARWNYVNGRAAVRELNEISTAYFTNPHIHWSNQKAQDHFWQDFLAQIMPYQRGFVYFLRLSALIQQHTNDTRSLDDAVREFSRLRANNYRHDTSRWIELLGAGFLPPDEANAGYVHMIEGGVVRPEGGDPLGIGLEMQRTWCPKFELGFDITSLTTRHVTNLSRSSRAAGAGLRDGDQILAIRGLDASLRNTSKTLEMEVMRGQAAFSVTFLPRSEVAVECYLWVFAGW
jgi:predicted metalloprotease with PDZ domain